MIEEASKSESTSYENFTKSFKNFYDKNQPISTSRVLGKSNSLLENISTGIPSSKDESEGKSYIKPGLAALLKKSSNQTISSIFNEQESDVVNESLRKLKKAIVVSPNFKKEISSLEYVFSSTNIFFVKCLNPNEECSPTLFDGRFIRKQIDRNQVNEISKIRCAGLAKRFSFRDFYNRYRKISKLKSLPESIDSRKACLLVMKKIAIHTIPGKILVGKVYF